MEQQDLHLQRLGLGSLASTQVGSWGAWLPSSPQDSLWKARTLSGCPSAGGQLAVKEAGKKATLQDSVVYLLTWLLSVPLMNQHTDKKKKSVL